MDLSSSHYHPDNAEKEKFVVDAAEFPTENGSPLPDFYGDNRLVLLPRDPAWFFAYWEINQERADQIRQQHGRDIWERAALVLRVYEDDGSFFDVELHKQARQWYVSVRGPGRSYAADLGLRLPDGTFISLIHSNRITLPAGRVSDLIDAQWMAVGMTEEEDLDRFRRLAAGADQIGKGSAEFSKSMALRWEFLKSVYSGSASGIHAHHE